MITNSTRKATLATHQGFCITHWEKARGLMVTRPAKGLDFGLVLVFRKKRSIVIDMSFMRYSIDLMFLDEDYNVVALRNSIKPFSIHPSWKPACYAVELPAGILQKTKTKVGDKIEIQTGPEGAYSDWRKERKSLIDLQNTYKPVK